MDDASVGRPMGEAALREALAPEDKVQRLVSRFYDDEKAFAGTTFLDLPEEDPNAIESSDLLAVTLMGETYPAAAVRTLLRMEPWRSAVTSLLVEIPKNLEIWSISDSDLHDEDGAPVKLWRLLDQLYGVGPTKTSKLMARKRPGLIPIYDRWIGEKVASRDDYWHVFHRFLSDASNRDAVNKVRPTAPGPRDLPGLRILDTAVWMRYSEGTPAKDARAACRLE